MDSYISIDNKRYDICENNNNTIDKLILYQNKEYNISIFCTNDNLEYIKLNIGGIEFLPKEFCGNEYKFGNGRFFSCMWGYAQVIVIIKYYDREGENFFYSSLFNVYLDNVKNSSDIKNSMEKMVAYIIENNHIFLQYLCRGSYTLIDCQNSHNIYKSFLAEIQILKNIIECYDRNYSYFMRDSKYKLMAHTEVDDFHKINRITPSTIKYICKNPYELQSVDYETGIHIGNRNFKPNNVVMSKNNRDYNIYENQVILGFIMLLILDIEEKIKTIKNKNKNIKYNSLHKTINFLYDIFLRELEKLLPALEEIYHRYVSILHCDNYVLEEKPVATSIFLTSVHYREVYINIEKWFDINKHNFNKELDYITTFQTADQIYEYYTLIKLIKLLESTGFQFETSRAYKYEDCNYIFEYDNTFEFYKDLNNKRLTLYYQPVIYSYQLKNNITLYRTRDKKSYYMPDFLLKFEINNKVSYIIMDAKWQSLTTIKKYTLDDIIKKYIYSIDDYYGNKVEAIILLQGRRDFTNKFEYQSSELSRSSKLHNMPRLKVLCLIPELDYSNIIRDEINNLIC